MARDMNFLLGKGPSLFLEDCSAQNSQLGKWQGNVPGWPTSISLSTQTMQISTGGYCEEGDVILSQGLRELGSRSRVAPGLE